MFAAVFIPNFSLQAALRLEPKLRSRAVALVDADSPQPGVLQLTSAARARGVEERLTSPQAVARCADLIIKPRSPAQEQSATDILLQTAGAFSPNIESTAPGICTIDLKGLPLGGEMEMRQWAGKILSTLSQFQFEAQIGFAATPGLALITAQSASPVLVAENPRQLALALPMAALQPPAEITGILSLWGVQSIGTFLALGRNDVARRLGPVAADLFDILDLEQPLKIVTPPQLFAEQIEFEQEIETTQPLLFAIHRLLEQLVQRLEAVYRVVAELDLQFTLVSGAIYRKTFQIPSATNNLQVLFRMLQTHLETLRTDAPIIALQIKAEPGKSEQHQFGLFEATLRDPNRFAETFARLIALCGPRNTGTPELEQTHRPDAFRMKTPDFSRLAPTVNRNASAPLGLQLRRFRPLLAAVVEFRQNRPALIRSQTIRGAVRASEGPFLASGDWWDRQGWMREEWDVQMADGSLCRVVRSAAGCFVEGVYD